MTIPIGIYIQNMQTRWSGSTRNWSLEEEVWLNPEKVTPIQAGQKSIN